MIKNEFNFEILENRVSTQYGDYSGYIQIDGHSGTDLFKLCEDNGIDMKNNFLVSFGMGESTINGIGQRNKISCRAIVLEREKYGSSFDSIKQELNENNGIADAKQYHFYIDPKDLHKYIKRFDFMVSTKISKHIKELKVKDVM